MTFYIAHWKLKRILLHFDMQGEIIIEQYKWKDVMCLHFSVQEEDILELVNVKCHLCTFRVNL